VLHEIDVNLLAHELIKVRVFSDDRREREALLARICGELEAAPVQHLGKVLTVWRPAPEPEKPVAQPREKSVSGLGKRARAAPRSAEPRRRGPSAGPRGKAPNAPTAGTKPRRRKPEPRSPAAPKFAREPRARRRTPR